MVPRRSFSGVDRRANCLHLAVRLADSLALASRDDLGLPNYLLVVRRLVVATTQLEAHPAPPGCRTFSDTIRRIELLRSNGR